MKARDPHFHPDVVPRKPGYLTAHRRQVKQGDRSFPMNRGFQRPRGGAHHIAAPRARECAAPRVAFPQLSGRNRSAACYPSEIATSRLHYGLLHLPNCIIVSNTDIVLEHSVFGSSKELRGPVSIGGLSMKRQFPRRPASVCERADTLALLRQIYSRRCFSVICLLQ